MSRYLEIVVAACLYYSGLVKLARFLNRRSGQKLVILCYHRASGGNLRKQLLYLKRHYRMLHLESALEEIYQLSKDVGQQRDQRTLLAATFDDGYRDNYTEGLALARELQVPITVFLVPTYIESGRAFAFLAGVTDHLVPYAQVNQATIEGRTYLLDRVDEQKKLTQAIAARVRYAPSIASREEYLASVRKTLAIPSSLTESEKMDLSLMWSEVEEMEKSAWVSFGAHTMHHPMLTSLTDPLEVNYEVGESRKVLEEKLGHSVRTFAYPYGAFSDAALNAVRAVQCNWAVTIMNGFNTAQTDPHQLKRIVVGIEQHWLVVAAKTSGVWEFFLRPCRSFLHFTKNIFRQKPVPLTSKQ